MSQQNTPVYVPQPRTGPMPQAQWARHDENRWCAEVIDFDPTDRFHPSVVFHPVQAELVGWIDEFYQWNPQTRLWEEPEEGYTLRKMRVTYEAEFTAAIQNRLDAFAKTRNYDNILSAATYVTSTVPKFAAEGQYAVESRDATWAKSYEIMGAVLAGTRPMPTLEEVLRELPALAWPDEAMSWAG